MSKKPIEKSSAASAQPGRVSVYDFLYHDARRVGSFLAQLDPDGLLQSIKKTQQTQRSQSAGSIMKGTAGVPGIVQLGGDSTDIVADQHGQSADRTYDPFWANALALLDLLDSAGLLVRDMHQAGVGQFVLIRGKLKIANLKVVESVLAQAGTPTLFNQGLAAFASDNPEASLAILKALPHPVQAYLFVDREPMSISWMPLEESNLITAASNLMLQYNPWLQGEWAVLGIKDASLDQGPFEDAELEAAVAADINLAAANRSTNPMSLLSEMIAPAARRAMGRPAGLYGITPVLIFREVA